MPYIMLQDPWGLTYHLTSNSVDVMIPWFDEVLPRVNQVDGNPARIMIMAVPDEKTGEPDWPVGNANGSVPFPCKRSYDAMLVLESLRQRGPWPYTSVNP